MDGVILQLAEINVAWKFLYFAGLVVVVIYCLNHLRGILLILAMAVVSLPLMASTLLGNGYHAAKFAAEQLQLINPFHPALTEYAQYLDRKDIGQLAAWADEWTDFISSEKLLSHLSSVETQIPPGELKSRLERFQSYGAVPKRDYYNGVELASHSGAMGAYRCLTLAGFPFSGDEWGSSTKRPVCISSR